MTIGILALQGAFVEHERVLAALGVRSFEIRSRDQLLKPMDGLILPGGESTVMGKLLRETDALCLLRKKIADGLPVFGTCAGMILLAKELENGEPPHLQAMDIRVKRNAYGRQLGSFRKEENFNGSKIPLVFIRAPYVAEYGKDVQVLSVCEGKTVAVRQNNCLATAFHPELTSDTTVHEYFIEEFCRG